MISGQDSKLKFLMEHLLVFIGDLLPYTVMFLLTLMVSYKFGLAPAGFFSLTFAYVAVVTTVVCGPNLLSLRRRMPNAKSAGAVVAASLGLRAAVITVGATLLMACLLWSEAQATMIPLIALLFVGRVFETAVDGPATSVQYLRGPRHYFLMRLAIAILMCGFSGVAILTANDTNLIRVACFYVFGSGAGFLLALAVSRRLLTPITDLLDEFQCQASEFSKFFVATALFAAASRIHPIIIVFFSGDEAAGQFALVQNLFSALALAATAVAGVFFWSQNRNGTPQDKAGIHWRWLIGGLAGGLVLGLLGGVLLDFGFVRPLGASVELSATAWILCLSTPLLLTQAIISNSLVLQMRDREMLLFSVSNAIIGLLLITLFVYVFGLVGAALSVAVGALVSTLVGIFVVRRTDE